MSLLPTLGALTASLAAFGYLAATDAKRRRVFGQDPRPRAGWQTATALTTLAAPGVLLLVGGDAAGFVIWLGAVSVAGWGLAALPPRRGEGLAAEIAMSVRHAWHQGQAAAQALGHLRRLPARVAELEVRVADLEAELGRRRLERPAAE